MTKNIGLIGGTFDPVHLGHLAIAVNARQELNLAQVVFIPAGQPYFKDLAYISPAKHRVNMLKLAIANKPYFKISLIEIKRHGPTYTINTVYRIKSKLKSDDEIYLVMGWDSLLTLHQWQEPQRLISLCRIAVAPRPGYPHTDFKQLEKRLPGISQRAVELHSPPLNISATEIRERVCQGLSIEKKVPALVAQYIGENSLYKQKRP